MTEIFPILEELASDAGRNFKISVLQKHKSNELLKEVVFLALDPFTQFYIRKIPKYQRGIHTIPLSGAIKQLKKLSNRTVTGNAAIDLLADLLGSLEEGDAKVLERIIQKDLKCGVAAGTVNVVWKDMIHEYPCMLCSGYEEKLISKVKFPAMVQLKMDGMRFNAIVRNGNVEFRSRNGKEINLLGNLAEDCLRLSCGRDVVFDGELLVGAGDDIMDRQTGNGILNKAVKGTISAEEAQSVCATLWDVIPYEEFVVGHSDSPYQDRFERLQKLDLSSGRIRLVEFKTVQSLGEAREIFNTYLAAGQEGIILKDLTGTWQDKRVKHQIKFKGELECDLEVVGYEEGTGKYAGQLGALVCRSRSTDAEPITVNVGSGFNDDHRTSLWSVRDKLLGKIVALKYNSRIKNKQGGDSLFLPIFLELREDKDTADSAQDIK